MKRLIAFVPEYAGLVGTFAFVALAWASGMVHVHARDWRRS